MAGNADRAVWRIVSTIAWCVGTAAFSTVVAAELFVGAVYLVAVSEANGERWLKLAFWILAVIPIVAGIAALRLGLRGVLPGTRRAA
jgi:hypothetical protein